MKTEYAEMCSPAKARISTSQPVAGLSSALHGKVTGKCNHILYVVHFQSVTAL